MITLALSKGRIFDDSLPLLAAAGIEVLEDPEKSRKLIIGTSRPDVRVVLVRASDVPARWLLQAATRNGAAALGLSDLGAIEAGYRARLITVALPAHALDVEEWLVGGLDAAAIDWLPGEAGRPSGRT